MEEQSIDFHLREALQHLEIAMNQSMRTVLDNERTKKEIGQKWENFLAEFFHDIREKSKKSKLNLLSWITFPKLR